MEKRGELVRKQGYFATLHNGMNIENGNLIQKFNNLVQKVFICFHHKEEINA